MRSQTKTTWDEFTNGFRKIVAIVSISVLFISAINPFVNIAQAEGESIWSGNIVLSDDAEATDDDSRSNTICNFGQVRTRKTAQGNVIRNDDGTIRIYNPKLEQRSDPIDSCILQNTQGLFAGNRWTDDSNPNKMLELSPSTVEFHPAPSGDIVLIRTNNSYGYSLSVNYNFAGIEGRLTADGQAIAQLGWRVINYSDSLRYTDGQTVRFLSHAFSANGKYVVGHLTSGHIVKINLKNLEMQPVYVSGPLTHLSISSDGDYILSYRSGNLLLHDTTTCLGSTYTKNAWPANGYDVSGCTQQNLYSRVSTLYPQVGNGSIGRLRFGLNSASLSVDGGWRYPDGVTRWRRFTFTPENYTSSAEGYLAMGDSFSSGEGDTKGGTWYEQGTDEQGDINTFAGRNLCHLSRRSYPYLMAIEFGYLANNADSPPADGLFHSVACSGAKIHNVIGGLELLRTIPGTESNFANTENQYANNYFGELNLWQPGRIKQLDFFEAENYSQQTRPDFEPEVITLGIGGNDAGFGDHIAACVGLSTCSAASPGSVDATNVALAIAELKPRLVNTYKQVKNTNPDARVYVHGYPLFVKGYGGDCGVNVRLDAQETAFVEEGVKYMNAVVNAAASEAGVFYIDIEDALNGKNLCSSVPSEEKAVNGATAGNDSSSGLANFLSFGVCKVRTGCLGKESFHPNEIGHDLYRSRIRSLTNDLTTTMPSAVPTPYPLPDTAFFGQQAVDIVELFNTAQYSDYVIPESRSLLAVVDNSLTVAESNLLPGSTILIEIQSDPVVLGEYIVDSSGRVDVPITIPDYVVPGSHEVHIHGNDRFGNEVDYFEPIWVSSTIGDFDGDGVADHMDACPTLQNGDVDTDQDGVDDACDGYVDATPDPDPDPEPETPRQRFCSDLEELFTYLKQARPRWLYRHPKRIIKQFINYYCT